MSDASSLKAGDSLCDPFCGRRADSSWRPSPKSRSSRREFEPKGGKVVPKITFRGYDKGTDEKDDERTIILAKANMLV